MTYKCLLFELKDGVATLTLNRPERLNALGDTLRDDLHDAILKCSDNPEVRVIVITGAGKGFCSGGDVKAMNEAKEGRRERPLGEKIAPNRDLTLLAMRDAPQPIIAAINGAAAGAGMNLALGCDIRIASTAAKFSQAFAELIFTGELIDAQEALRLGIVSQVVPPEELMGAVGQLAHKIAAGPPVAIRLAKRSLYDNAERDLKSSLERETFSQNIASETEDAREGIRAFVEKRDPKFQGR
jgi:2-(1,2-epoxy-1,2-dihydrophenyl)acetyl-CoA isomerase